MIFIKNKKRTLDFKGFFFFWKILIISITQELYFLCFGVFLLKKNKVDKVCLLCYTNFAVEEILQFPISGVEFFVTKVKI